MTRYTKHRVSFDSAGSTIAAVMYLPTSTAPTMPCVVLAHGFSGTMDWIVPEFAARFADGGLAALIFDYRFLGESEGEPRQLIISSRQRDDLRRAVDYVRSRTDIDASRVALWGTSLGGNHVLTLAQEDPTIAAVVANVPAVDMFSGIRGRYVPPHMRMPMRKIVGATMRLLGAAILDQARGALGLAPFYIEVFGRLGHAAFSDPDLTDLFAAVEQNAPSWRNRVTPRFLLTAPRYRDGSFGRIAAPLMVTVARDDEVMSTSFIKEKVAQAPHHQIREYPVRHFDMYHGAVRDEVAADHLAFLQLHLMDQGCCSDREPNGLRSITFGPDANDAPRRRTKT
ncbi:alpha/beta fold hydrolase [Mycolicibacterium stellerae]|uniref:alpha/beta fold hydrolase n=1 Tax=Mycolicibacterium stellerae TaxID=2358193 RepID=UPI000F0B4A65|nr:alpha/beta fold hydrolase [Mycolicibacterium stellerae]